MTIASAALLLFLILVPLGNIPVFLSMLRRLTPQRQRIVLARELLIALLVPRFAERRLRRSIQRGRIALMIGLAVWVGVTAIVMFAGGTPLFTK